LGAQIVVGRGPPDDLPASIRAKRLYGIKQRVNGSAAAKPGVDEEVIEIARNLAAEWTNPRAKVRDADGFTCVASGDNDNRVNRFVVVNPRPDNPQLVVGD
jgi:hypothetical protein